uniref:Uncharacterized protein n=1 Tax=Anguilla anguilla TaxID=7936 RepID=A0A0E9T530_ANGAN
MDKICIQLGLVSYAFAGRHAPYLYGTESLAVFRVPYRNNHKHHIISALKTINFCTFLPHFNKHNKQQLHTSTQ